MTETTGPRRPSRRRLSGLAGPTPTGVTANDQPEPDASRAPAREGARAPAQPGEQAPPRAGRRASKRTPGQAAEQAGEPAGGRSASPAGGHAGAAALAPAAEQVAGWAYEDRRAWELRARAYAAALARTRDRGAELATASVRALGAGATPADLAAALRDAGLGVGDVPPDVARVAGLE
jgi:hypothetical protein